MLINRLTIYFCWIGVFLTVVVPHCPVFAADAVCVDGNRVFTTASPDGGLVELDLRQKTKKRIDIPRSMLQTDECIEAVSCGKEGTVYCLTPHRILLYDPAESHFVEVYRAPLGINLHDIAYNPADDYVYFTTGEGWGKEGMPIKSFTFNFLLRGQTEPHRINCRRINYILCPIFSPEGQLYFSYEGDLWLGGLVYDEASLTEDGEGEKTVKWPTWIFGSRVAPLACLETSGASSSSLGVDEIAPAGPLVYVHTQRIGGSGMGNILSLKIFPGKCDYNNYIKALSSIHIVNEQAAIRAHLCASTDGSKVLYHDYKHDYYLIEGNGDSKKISFTKP